MAKHSDKPEKGFLSLPRLSAGHGMQIPTTNEWTHCPDALSQISRSIDTQSSAERGQSIPDIFSQSIQFEFELSVGNPAAVGQWQGLIATLLLAGSGGLARVRTITPEALGGTPFARIFQRVSKRRGIAGITLFELKRKDGTYGAVAFCYDGMPTMLCPAAQIRGPFAVEDDWIIETERGLTFTSPSILLDDRKLVDRRIALRNEIYALARRDIPIRENRDGVQLTCLKRYFEWLSLGGDGISSHPVNEEVRAKLFTVDPARIKPPSDVFTDRLCLFRVGDAHNHLSACSMESMCVFSQGQRSDWRALLPLRRAFALPELSRLRTGALHVKMQWHNGAVDAELLDESDTLLAVKRYHIADFVNFTRHRNAPQVAVWPPKSMAGWNRYYLLCFDDGNALPLSPHVLGVGDAPEAVTLLSQMPLGISFSYEGGEVGLLLPVFETAQNAKSREINIGFDFGTTGTTVYKHEPAAGITSPVSFTYDGVLFLFGRKEGADVALTTELVAERIADRATHFSLLRRKTDLPTEGGALTQASIPFLTSAAFNPQIIRDVSDNLKWGRLPQDKVRAHLFLEQYLMMCLWNAIENGASMIHWRASYPLSMHAKLQEEYAAKIESILAGLCTHCYQCPYNVYFCSESEAVGFMMMDNTIQARYLKGQTINDMTGFFCLDIGGGSTDLSLWQHRKPLSQASLHFAGNAILCDTITRENRGDGSLPWLSLIDFFFSPGASEGKRGALQASLESGRYDEFRRVFNVLVDEIADAVKGLHRDSDPLLSYLNVVRFNLYMIFFFAGRMVREALLAGADAGTRGTPLPVAVLGNGAKMMKLLYNDVEMIKQPGGDGTLEWVSQERRNASRYADEMQRLTNVLKAGCGIEGFEAVVFEPFLPKQETARGLAIAPEAYLVLKSARPAHADRDGWPLGSAFDRAEDGTALQTLTHEFRTLVMDSFLALRVAFADDGAFRTFLSSVFSSPTGEHMFNVEAFADTVWTQCLRHNPEPMLPGQPLPPANTISGRFVEMLMVMNQMMKIS